MAEETTLDLQEDQIDETSLKYMLKLASPMIVTTISFTVMQFVDRSMVARLGKEALAAVLPAGMISFIPASFALGVITCLNIACFDRYVPKSYSRGSILRYTLLFLYHAFNYFNSVKRFI